MATALPSSPGMSADWNQDRRPNLYGALIFFIVLTVLVVFVRGVCQVAAHRKLFWDDLLVLLALIFNLGLISADIFGMTRGLGLHIDRVMASDPRPPSALITLWKVGWVNSICIYLCLFCTKMSLLWLYRRLFWVAPWFRTGWYMNLAYAIALAICAFFTAVFQCTPVSYAWTRMYLLTHIPAPFLVAGHCIDSRYATYQAALSLSSDLAIWVLPVIAIGKLKMTLRRKMELCLLLSLGLVACVCGLVKAIVSNRAIEAKDVSWANAPLAVWAAAEQSTGILCACIPVIVGSAKAMRVKRQKTSSAYKAGYADAHPASSSSGKPHSTVPNSKLPATSATRESIDEGNRRSDSSACHMRLPNASDDMEMQPPRQHAEWM